MTKHKMNTIVVTVKFPEELTQGTSDSFFNPLARPLRRVLENGIIGRITYTFYQEPVKPIRTFGSFCYTPGERLLFFPGIVNRRLRWNSERKKKVEKFNLPNNTLIDHYSLEKDLDIWNITLLDGKGEKKYPLRKYKTRKYPDDTCFWFAISVKSPSVLDPTPQELKLMFSSPETDSERRVKDIVEAREDAIFSILSPPDGMTLNEDEYLHFAVLVTKEKRDVRYINSLQPPLNFPITPPSLESPVEMETQMPVRTHPVRLQGFPGSVFIIVAKHKGILSNEAVITSPLE